MKLNHIKLFLNYSPKDSFAFSSSSVLMSFCFANLIILPEELKNKGIAVSASLAVMANPTAENTPLTPPEKLSIVFETEKPLDTNDATPRE